MTAYDGDGEPTFGGALASYWALTGVAVLFTFSVVRLGHRGVTTLQVGLSPFEWAALGILVVTFFYGEGVRALQAKWVPRLIRRAGHLRGEESVLFRVLGPIYGMSLVGADRKGLIRGWGILVGIVLAVALVSRMPDPWRGIIDLAVATALAWGLIWILYGFKQLHQSVRE